jgi:(R,R)-butanediol dehydrogenase/meso-butanediol dehydrogenase/diacetyl reductase
MKAARYYGKEDIRIEDIAEPAVRPGALKITPAFNGVCGSDLHLYYGGPFPPAPTADAPHPLSEETLPVVFGHEFSGVIEEIGEGVEGFFPGDAVVVEPLMVDGTCPACKAGRYNLCESMGFIGISGMGGGLCEHIVVESRWVHHVGDMPLDQAALIEPLSVALHAVKHAGVEPGKVAVIGGAGPIGLLTAAVLHAMGLKTMVSEVSPERRAKALSSAVADVVIDPSAEDLKAVVAQHTNGAMADYAFDAAGLAPVVNQLLDSLAGGGRLEVVALHAKPMEIDIMGKLTMGDRAMGASVGYANDHEQAVELVRSGKVNLEPFITSRIKVDDLIEQGFERLIADRSEVKVVVSMS